LHGPVEKRAYRGAAGGRIGGSSANRERGNVDVYVAVPVSRLVARGLSCKMIKVLGKSIKGTRIARLVNGLLGKVAILYAHRQKGETPKCGVDQGVYNGETRPF